MKLKAFLLIFTVCFSTLLFAQRKTTKRVAKTDAISQTEKKSEKEERIIKEKQISEATQQDATSNKYDQIIEKYASRISEVERMINEKAKAYQSDDKMKKNTAVIDEITNARYKMIAELIGEDAAKYYFSKHK